MHQARIPHCVFSKATLSAVFLTGLTLAGIPSTAWSQVVVGSGTTVTVPGTESSPWTIPNKPGADGGWRSPDFVVRGVLEIRNGGVVNSRHTVITRNSFLDPIATVSVVGPGSVWNNTGDVNIADETEGSFSVANGGTAHIGGLLLLGNPSFPHGGGANVTIEGSGSIVHADALVMTSVRRPLRTDILDGGVLNTASRSFIGNTLTQGSLFVFSANAQVVISGQGSRWNADGGASIQNNDSRIVISNEGRLTAPDVTLGDSTYPGYAPRYRGGALIVGGGYDDTCAQNCAVGDATAPGRVDVGTINFANGGSLIFNHTASDYRFDSMLVGGETRQSPNSDQYPDFFPPYSGEIKVYAGTTILTADSSGFAGETTVLGGKLILDGRLGGNASVQNGGWLGGKGSLLGNVRVQSGGHLFPGGDEAGQLRVGGNLTFDAGSILNVDVTPAGVADRILVNGITSINGGSVIAVSRDSGFRPFTSYTILEATGGVNGRFDSISTNFAFLNPTLAYTSNSITLRLVRNDVDFSSVASTRNQRATAAAVNQLGNGNAIWDSVIVLDSAEARSAFDALSGDIHPSNMGIILQATTDAQRMALDRMRTSGTAFWGDISSYQGSISSDGNSASLKISRHDIFVGKKTFLDHDWYLGAYAGRQAFENESGSRGAASQGESLHLGLSVDREWGNWDASASVSSTHHNMWTTRTVVMPFFSETLSSHQDATSVQFAALIGYTFNSEKGTLRPYMGAHLARLHTKGFQEIGGYSTLGSGKNSFRLFQSIWGLQGRRDFGKAKQWSLDGDFAWQYTHGNLDTESETHFQNGNGFNILGAPLARNALSTDLVITRQIWDGFNISGYCSGLYSSGYRNTGLGLVFSAKF